MFGGDGVKNTCIMTRAHTTGQALCWVPYTPDLFNSHRNMGSWYHYAYFSREGMDAQDQQFIQMVSNHNGTRTKDYPGSESVSPSNAELGYCHSASSKSEPGPLETTEVNLLSPKKCTYRKEGDLPEVTEQDKGRVRWFREVGIRRWLHTGGSNMGIIFIILPSSSTCRNVTSVSFQQDQSADCEVRVCVCAHARTCMNTWERPPLGSPHP